MEAPESRKTPCPYRSWDVVMSDPAGYSAGGMVSSPGGVRPFGPEPVEITWTLEDIEVLTEPIQCSHHWPAPRDLPDRVKKVTEKG